MWMCVLGRQPELSLAELEARFGADHVSQVRREVALVEAETVDVNRLGGSITVGRVLGEIGSNSLSALPKQLLEYLPPAGSKQDIGLSVYGELGAREVGRLALELKKLAKAAGHKVRIVPNKEPVLSSAQVLHNQLAKAGNAEFVVAVAKDKTYVAQTTGVQDINAYRQRDIERLARDARVGMLPPKLAQIMLNLAVGRPVASSKQRVASNQNPQGLDGYKEAASSGVSGNVLPRMSSGVTDDVAANSAGGASGSATGQASTSLTVLDPFCGTGVVLQEALLMGFSAYGSDIAERMVRMSQTNLVELARRYPDIKLDQRLKLEVADARSRQWSPPLDAVVSELYLGPAFSGQPTPAELDKAVREVDALLGDTLANLHGQIDEDTRVVLAVPRWQSDGRAISLPTLDRLEKIGYTSTRFVHAPGDLVYAREDQIVARQLLVLSRS